jgi:excisionase family DNA binding protein
VKSSAAAPLPSPERRLYNVRQAALYLNVSAWTIRDLIASGHLPRIALPSLHHSGEMMRRVLIDRADLDQLIERFKEGPARQTEAPAEPIAATPAPRATRLQRDKRCKPANQVSTAPPLSRPYPPAPLGKAPDVTRDDIRGPVRLDGPKGNHWARIVRNSVDTNGLFRCCLKQIVHREQQRGPKVPSRTQLTCPFCQNVLTFRGGWELLASGG